MEPSGWMVRGLPANFIADVTTNTTEGSLLGRPITVRFEPVSYTWTWGDGESDTVREPGRTWDDLAVGRFSETPTSHTYTERGTVTVSLSVAYAVSYRIDGGEWSTVTGSVSAETTLDAYVGSAETVLVPGDCRADPDATGC
jgi:PKD repeat protein